MPVSGVSNRNRRVTGGESGAVISRPTRITGGESTPSRVRGGEFERPAPRTPTRVTGGESSAPSRPAPVRVTGGESSAPSRPPPSRVTGGESSSSRPTSLFGAWWNLMTWPLRSTSSRRVTGGE